MSNVILEKVSRKFGEFAAVSDVDLRVNEGEFLTLLGPSGCGKTTTLRMVAGLEQNTAGRISIGDEVVRRGIGVFVPSERRLGMVFQSYAIWPHMTVFENVAYPLRCAVVRRPKSGFVSRALRLVEMEGLPSVPHRLCRRPATTRRHARSRSLSQRSFSSMSRSAIDTKLRLQMGDEFRAIQRRLGMTTIYVTHDQSEAMALSDRVVVMDHGKIQQIGAPEDIYRYPATRTVAAFFGTPNLLDATVEECDRIDEGRVRLDVVGRGWRGKCESSTELKPGRAVTVMVRPEDARIASLGFDAADKDLKWAGRIAHMICRGPSRSVFVETEQGRLNVDAPAFGQYSVGDNVIVVVPQHAVWAVAAEEAIP